MHTAGMDNEGNLTKRDGVGGFKGVREGRGKSVIGAQAFEGLLLDGRVKDFVRGAALVLFFLGVVAFWAVVAGDGFIRAPAMRSEPVGFEVC